MDVVPDADCGRIGMPQSDPEVILWRAPQAALTTPDTLSQALNVEAGPISKCCNGAQRTAHGHEFKFALEKHQPDLSLKPQVTIAAQSATEVTDLGEFGELKEPEDVVDMTLRAGSEEKWLLYPDRTAVMQLMEYLRHSIILLGTGQFCIGILECFER